MKRIIHLLFGVAPASPARRRKPRRPVACMPASAGPALARKRRKSPAAATKSSVGPGQSPMRRPSSGTPTQPRQGKVASDSGGTLVYHGTPSLAGARSILRHGWIVGTGNTLGDGIYTTTSATTAKSYAGASGYLIKARLQPGRCATWSTALTQSFQTWCAQRKCPADTPARTAFLLERGFTTLREREVYVVLHRGYRNPAATKIRPACLRVLEVLDAATGRPVRI